MKNHQFTKEQKKALSALCGLFCPSCIIYIAQKESIEKQKEIAKNLRIPIEMLKCDGCRTERRFYYCENNCKMMPCAKGRGVDFCGECDDYPCDIIKTFQAEMPHRLELWAAHDRIREVGYEQWFDEMMEHYSCPECDAINTAYHLTCRVCGTSPSCEYTNRNKEEIENHPFFRKSS